MAQIEIGCPGCQVRGRVEDTDVGRQIRCKKCGMTFTVTGPAPAGIAASVATPLAQGGPPPPAKHVQRIKCSRCGMLLDEQSTEMIKRVDLLGVKKNMATCSCGASLGVKDLVDVPADAKATTLGSQVGGNNRNNPPGARGNRTQCPHCKAALNPANREAINTVEQLGPGVSGLTCHACGKLFGSDDYPLVKVTAPEKMSVWLRTAQAAQQSSKACEMWVVAQVARGLEPMLRGGNLPAEGRGDQFLFNVSQEDFPEAVRQGVRAKGGDPNEVFVHGDIGLWPIGYNPGGASALAQSPGAGAAAPAPQALGPRGGTRGNRTHCPLCGVALDPVIKEAINTFERLGPSVTGLTCTRCGRQFGSQDYEQP